MFCLDGATYFEKLQMHVALPSVLLTVIVAGIVATILVKKKEKQRGTFNPDSVLCCDRISGRVQLKKGKKGGFKMVAPNLFYVFWVVEMLVTTLFSEPAFLSRQCRSPLPLAALPTSSPLKTWLSLQVGRLGVTLSTPYGSRSGPRLGTDAGL